MSDNIVIDDGGGPQRGGLVVVVILIAIIMLTAWATSRVYSETARMRAVQVQVYKELYTVKSQQFAALVEQINKQKATIAERERDRQERARAVEDAKELLKKAIPREAGP